MSEDVIGEKYFNREEKNWKRLKKKVERKKI
jgi:hypothetical protein